MPETALDTKDLRILDRLQRDARISNVDLAQAVNLSVVNGSLLCVAQLEKLCVLNCRPSLVRWQGQRVRVLRVG
jgi:hypothetical protein